MFKFIDSYLIYEETYLNTFKLSKHELSGR